MIDTPHRINDPIAAQWEQTSATLRWLANSGPRYRDVVVTLIAFQGDAVSVEVDGKRVWIHKQFMSYGSWCMCMSGVTGVVLELRLRSDPVVDVMRLLS